MKNAYALITGAGEGLGRSFALCCAARGYNLLLVSLPGSRLQILASRIEAHYGVKVWHLEINLCESGAVDHLLAFAENHQLPVKLLVNNAGLGHTCRFDELTEAYLQHQLNLNMLVLTQLVHSLIPLMREQGGGHILNIGSMAGFYALPFKNSYAASKAYVLALSLALNIELAPQGIGVSVVCPNGICSNIKQYMIYRQSGWLARWCYLNPDEVAAYALDKSLEGKALIIPGRINRVIRLFSTLMPPMLKRFLARKYVKPARPVKVAATKLYQAA